MLSKNIRKNYKMRGKRDVFPENIPKSHSRSIEIDVDDIIIRVFCFNIILKCFKQLGFTTTTNTSNNLNVWCSNYVDHAFGDGNKRIGMYVMLSRE